MKAIILARVSKEDQLEGQSIPAQLARSRQWCKDKKLVIKKIELKKFCKWCRKQTKHKEIKK